MRSGVLGELPFMSLPAVSETPCAVEILLKQLGPESMGLKRQRAPSRGFLSTSTDLRMTLQPQQIYSGKFLYKVAYSFFFLFSRQDMLFLYMYLFPGLKSKRYITVISIVKEVFF
jgi:hypothetical protein